MLGEVVTLPGGWSSYPPHHHPQPEIYHYRFTHPQGFGHAEHGDDVFKVRQYDTIRIQAGNDHAQVAAPGYGMYYAWVIRHLPGQPYDVPEFTAEHAWTMKPGREDLGAAAASRRGRQATRVSPSDAQRSTSSASAAPRSTSTASSAARASRTRSISPSTSAARRATSPSACRASASRSRC